MKDKIVISALALTILVPQTANAKAGSLVDNAPKTVKTETKAKTNKSSFKDVKKGDWYYTTVTDLTNKEVIKGYQDGTFKPNSTITTAEYLMLLNNQIGEKQPNAQAEGTGMWYTNMLKYLENKGVIGTVEPNSKIKRKDVAKYTAKALETLKGKELSTEAPKLKDYETLNGAEKEAIAKVYNAGVMTGDEKGNFNAEEYLTRAESAQIIKNLEKQAKPSEEKPKEEQEGFIDNSGTYMTLADYEKLEQEEGLQLTDPDKPLIWKEKMQRPFARQPKEGDIVIRANGERVTLVRDKDTDVLALNQGLDLYTGFQFEVGGNLFNTACHGFNGWLGSNGDDVGGQPYSVDPKTGEAHFRGEWVDVSNFTQEPPYVIDGEDIDYNALGYKVGDRPLEVTVKGKTFKTKGWMEWTGKYWQDVAPY